MRYVSPGQHRLNAQVAQPDPMCIRIIGSVTLHALRTTARTTGFSPHGRDSGDQWLQLGDVGHIGTAQASRQRDAASVGDEVVFAACFGPICGVWTRFVPPFRARSEALSTTARDQSIWSASWSLARRTSCNRCHTPAACQSRSRRQQVIPLPQPISWGRSSQPIPVFSTNTIPVSARRLSIGFRPGYRNRRGLGAGKSGAMSDHNLLSMSGFAIRKDLPFLVNVLKASTRLSQFVSFC